MSKNIGHVGLLFAAAILLVSCLDTDYSDGTALYDDIAITQFSITNAKMTMHTTSSTGEDSVYTADNQSVADYPFYIDQQRGEIYNVDSLPYGADPTTLLCECYTKNNAMVFIESASRDSMRTLQSTDSTDFSRPRYLRAYASNGETYRLYRVTVNIHRARAGQFGWTRLADNAQLAQLGGMRMVASAGGGLTVFGPEGGATVAYTTADGAAWTRTATAMGPDAYNNIVAKGDTLFALDGTRLLAAAGGLSFETVAAAAPVSRLVGASSTELYGLGAAGIMVSADGGRTWRADAMGDDAAELPAEDLTAATVPFAATDSADYVLLAGNRSAATHEADTTARVWRKIVEYAAGSERGQWIYMEADSRNRYPLPRLRGLTVIDYDGRKLAFGGAGVGACHEAPFSRIYESRDGGLTWKPSETYAMPEGFDTATSAFAAAADGRGDIWIVCAGSGQVWRGRLNSIGWAN